MTQTAKNECLVMMQRWAQEDNIPLDVRKETKDGFKGTYTIYYDGMGILYNLSKSEIYKAYAGLYNFVTSVRMGCVKV